VQEYEVSWTAPGHPMQITPFLVLVHDGYRQRTMLYVVAFVLRSDHNFQDPMIEELEADPVKQGLSAGEG